MLDVRAAVADGLWSIEEAARFLRVGRSTIYQLLAAGTVPHVKIGRATRVPRAALVEYAAANLRGGNGQETR